MLRLTDEQIAMLDADGQKAYKAMVGENDALSKAVAGGGKFSLRVGSKGTISINGFGRWPFSPYIEQWQRFEHWLTKEDGFKTIHAFIAANKGALSTKAAAVVAAAAAETVAAAQPKA